MKAEITKGFAMKPQFLTTHAFSMGSLEAPSAYSFTTSLSSDEVSFFHMRFSDNVVTQRDCRAILMDK